MDIKIVLDEESMVAEATAHFKRKFENLLSETLNPGYPYTETVASRLVNRLVSEQVNKAASKLAADPDFVAECECLYRDAFLKRVAERAKNRANRMKFPKGGEAEVAQFVAWLEERQGVDLAEMETVGEDA